jgi:hypothetical protein
MVPRQSWCRAALLFSPILLALVPLAARAEGESGGTAPTPIKAWQLTGRTLDEMGRPLPGARVFTPALPYLRAVSDADGRSLPKVRTRRSKWAI